MFNVSNPGIEFGVRVRVRVRVWCFVVNGGHKGVLCVRLQG